MRILLTAQIYLMNYHTSNLEYLFVCLFVFCVCFTVHHISQVLSCLPHIGGKYSSSWPGTLCALWLWKCHQPLPKSTDRRGGSFRGWNQKVSCFFPLDVPSTLFSPYISEAHWSVLIHYCYCRYTTLSYRAPEMVNLYGGNVITTKADIWVRLT